MRSNLFRKGLVCGILLLMLLIPSTLAVNVKTGREELSINLDGNALEDSLTKGDEASMDSPWPMYCHDVRHTGRSQYSTANNPLEEKWWFKTIHDEDYYHDWCFINIASDGTIYFTDVEGCIYALCPNGTLKWKFEGFDWHDVIECHPAIDNDGILYVGTAHGDFYAIYPNGTLKWKHDFNRGVMIFTSPAIDDDGVIYFGTCGDGHLYAFYSNSTLKWKFKLVSGCTYSSPAIADDGTIYLGDHAGYLHAIYPNGTLYWKVRLQNNYWIPSSPSIADDGTIYVATYNTNYPGHLYAINPDDGDIEWKYQIGSDYYVNPSLGEDGTIYVICSGNLYAINPDGTEKWTRKLGVGYIVEYSDPAISADGTIYVAGGNRIFAFNPDGTERWCKIFDIPYLFVESSPAIGEDGTIYLGLSHYREVEPLQYYDDTLYFHAFNERDPDAPPSPEITGPTKGVSGECYNYTIVSSDPNGDDIYYYVSWGEESYQIPMGPWVPSVLEEFGPFPSGEEITINHTWLWKGRYTIKVRAKDTNNLVSPWGTLEVRMPKNKQATYKTMFFQLFERFTNYFPLLERLLNFY